MRKSTRVPAAIVSAALGAAAVAACGSVDSSTSGASASSFGTPRQAANAPLDRCTLTVGHKAGLRKAVKLHAVLPAGTKTALARIQWGDDTVSTLPLVNTKGAWSVVASHTYSRRGIYTAIGQLVGVPPHASASCRVEVQV